jgi:serine phosphatase RsbU (regulator of sigma subunit)
MGDHRGSDGETTGELAAVRALLQVSAPTQAGLTAAFGRRLTDLLIRATDIRACAVLVDRDDGLGPVPLAWSGGQPAGATWAGRMPLPLTPPWQGNVMVDVPDPATRPSVELVAQRVAAALENERLRVGGQRQQERLSFLVEVGNLLAQSMDSALTAALIPRLVVPRLAPWCALYLLGRGGRAHVATAVHSDEAMTTQMLSDQGRLGVVLHSAEVRGLVEAGEMASLPAPLEGLLVPLRGAGETLGAIAVAQDGAVDIETITVLEEVARRAAAALANARAHEERQRVSHTLQQALLPPALPAVAGLEIGTRYVPAGRYTEVGGDLFDVIALPDGRTLCMIGDVAGKGAQAATVTSLVREVLRILVRDGKSVHEALGVLNATLRERSDRHCTLAVCELAPPTVDGAVPARVYLAGHDRPVLVRATGEAVQVGEWGTALGVLQTISCPDRDIVLRPGDSLVLYTDGATERRDGDAFFGQDRLHRTAAQLAGHPADVMAAGITGAVVDASAEPPRDDIAIVVVRNTAVVTKPQ